MLIDGQFPVAAPPPRLLAHLFDPRLMASCLPGCEVLEPLADDRYRAVVVIAMAGIKARFDLRVEITRRDEANVWAVTRGEEGGNASTLQADSQVSLEPTADGTLVRYRSEVAVTGRLGRFALGMMKKKAQSLGEEFAVNLQRKLEAIGEETAPPAPEPVDRSSAPGVPAQPARIADESVAPVTPVAPVRPPASVAPGATSAPAAPAATTVGAPIESTATPAGRDAPAPRRSWWQAFLAWWRGTPAVRPSKARE
jgi:carbon monoxide dehydrogenase subunit G